MVRIFERAGVKNVSFEVRRRAPGAGAAAWATARSAAVRTGLFRQHTTDLDLRPSSEAPGSGGNITDGNTGQNETFAMIDTSKLPAMSRDFVGPPSPDQISTQLANVGAHEIGHDVFIPGYHSQDGLMQDSVAPEVVSDPNLAFTPDEARALRNRFNTAEEQREYEREK